MKIQTNIIYNIVFHSHFSDLWKVASINLGNPMIFNLLPVTFFFKF